MDGLYGRRGGARVLVYGLGFWDRGVGPIATYAGWGLMRRRLVVGFFFFCFFFSLGFGLRYDRVCVVCVVCESACVVKEGRFTPWTHRFLRLCS